MIWMAALSKSAKIDLSLRNDTETVTAARLVVVHAEALLSQAALPAEVGRPSMRARLLSLLLHPTAAAHQARGRASFIVAETFLVYLLRQVAPRTPSGWSSYSAYWWSQLGGVWGLR